MKICLVVVVLFASSLAAADFEQLMLPVAPSVTLCAYHSRFDTRLVAYNDTGEENHRVCTNEECADLAPRRAREFEGVFAGDLPLPLFLYLPPEAARDLSLSLVVESSDVTKPEERSFTELPIVRARDFRTGRMQFIGVRMDPGFRQTVRIYGLDGHASGQLMMRVYSLDSSELLHECPHDLFSLTRELNADGQQLRPSFGMECNMGDHLEQDGKSVRIELEPLTPGLKYWAFLSVTNNVTQHFRTILPR